ncbi:hypothetical protein [Corynebacterium sp.]|uniref:hypothetical protein n=1 Tax=Corynebacterium sp. TaxID=1720 RepID=UPI0026DAAD6B|nr:hypothetical protein [Corynebacterium sp.]MDO5032845.1 hypothetical protein [Corynebacterium sp.]
MSQHKHVEEQPQQDTQVDRASARAALDFYAEQTKRARRAPHPLSSAVLAVVFALAYYLMWTVESIPAIVIAAVVAGGVILFALLGPWLLRRPKVRPSYKQNPRQDVRPDGPFFLGIAAIMLPQILTTFVEDHPVLAPIGGVLLGLAIFWVLYSRAFDLPGRNARKNLGKDA